MTDGLFPMSAPDRIQGDYYTDLWNAEQLVAAYGAELRYTPGWGWLCWDGARWQRDADSAAMQRAKATVRGYYARAAQIADEDARRRLVKHAIASESAGALAALLRLAADEPGIEVPLPTWDADPWRLSVANGTLDLRTGTLTPHDPAHYITRCLPVAYDPAAPAPRWIATLARIVPDVAVRSYLQRAVGYSLTGLVREQCLFFMYGTGRNGKSTFVETLQGLLDPDEYALKIPMDVLLNRRNESAALPTLAQLPGRRLVVASEVENGRRLNESLVKDLTGGDTIMAKHLYQAPFRFRPTFKLWIYGNHRPVIAGTDDGIWRRLHLIPFTEKISETEADPTLPEALQAELPGILAWAVAGCQAWLTTGLCPPPAVLAATREYRTEMDLLAQFLDERCLLGAKYKVPNKHLYAAYKEWADQMGDTRPLSGPMFSSQLKDKGFTSGPGAHNVTTWVGLALLDESAPPPPASRVNGVNGVSHFTVNPYARVGEGNLLQNTPSDLTHLTLEVPDRPETPCLRCGDTAWFWSAASTWECANCM